jgi:hypothetical protein
MITTYSASNLNTLFTQWLGDNAEEMTTEEYAEARQDFYAELFTLWLGENATEMTPEETDEAREDFYAHLPQS